ncbi:unnamed protein product [Tenebrio molitor]|nr:unnamed protein product [Tenebrio molitor]
MGTVMASGEETATKKRDQLFSFDTVSTEISIDNGHHPYRWRPSPTALLPGRMRPCRGGFWGIHN